MYQSVTVSLWYPGPEAMGMISLCREQDDSGWEMPRSADWLVSVSSQFGDAFLKQIDSVAMGCPLSPLNLDKRALNTTTLKPMSMTRHLTTWRHSYIWTSREAHHIKASFSGATDASPEFFGQSCQGVGWWLWWESWRGCTSVNWRMRLTLIIFVDLCESIL